ncbi:uncharacterized protein LOC115244389 [Formica exsecta]|uniref:uncharacterized protein LOC115244389 n=1 Tax=Formica exsecta TaxID=72781 RepID=UPI001144AAEC|nr:uncharacterized protein LOC115244389 [Formica exsecta]XP_029677839.1 uncharacterized protein LOC115244389 [Formica exsecta]
MNENFPQSKIHGCWFHFNQAILRKWRNLGLTQAPTDLLSIAMNIPLLPANLFPNAYIIMQDIANSISFQYPNIIKFLKYMTDTWLPIAEKVSTFGCPVRTNNAVESFNNIAAQKLRKPHSNIWIFLDNLKKLIIDQEIDFFRVKKDLNPRRTYRRVNRERNTKIANAQTALIEGRLPLQQFLRIFHKFNKQFLQREMNGEFKGL